MRLIGQGVRGQHAASLISQSHQVRCWATVLVCTHAFSSVLLVLIYPALSPVCIKTPLSVRC